MLKRKLCLFCIQKSAWYFDHLRAETDRDKIRKYIDKGFWWLRRCIDFAGKEEVEILNNVFKDWGL